MSKSFIEGVVYDLSIRYGESVDIIHKVGGGKFDPSTGLQTPPIVKRYKVRKAIIMTEEMLRELGESLGANYGGFFDRSKRVVIIPRRYLPKQYDVDLDDQVEMLGDRWDMKKFDFVGEASAYVIPVERIPINA